MWRGCGLCCGCVFCGVIGVVCNVLLLFVMVEYVMAYEFLMTNKIKE